MIEKPLYFFLSFVVSVPTVALPQVIPPGTVVAAGEPTVSLLNPDNKDLVTQHCLNCLRPCPAPHPCLTCSSVVFCSPTCRSVSHHPQHHHHHHLHFPLQHQYV